MTFRRLVLLSLPLFTIAIRAEVLNACVDPPPPPICEIELIPNVPGSCDYDLDGDGDVDPDDFQILQGQFGQPCPVTGKAACGDYNGNGIVDAGDISEWIAAEAAGGCNTETAIITVLDYESFGAAIGQSCACGFNRVGPIRAVTDVEIRDAATNLPIEGWDFERENTTSTAFNAIVGGGADFIGFVSDTTQPIPAGVDVILRFEISVDMGTTFAELETALLGTGSSAALLGPGPSGPLVVASDESDASGTPLGNHQGILPVSGVQLVSLPVPGLPVVGLIVLAASLVFAGLRARR